MKLSEPSLVSALQEDENTIASNFSSNVGQVSIQEEAVVAAQDSAFRNAEDEAEHECMQMGDCNEVGSNVRTNSKRYKHEVGPATIKNNSAAWI